jgi:hypothetical protein
MAESAGNRGWTEEPATFAAALEDLKTSGCLLLVVDSGNDAASASGCGRMLGTDQHADRRRLFVHGDAAAHARSDVRTPERDDERTVVYRTGARETTTATATTPDSASTRHDSTASDPDELADAVESAVDSLRPPSGYAAGQLRVCVDVVSELLATDDLASALSFTNRLGDVVTDVDGMLHVHVGDAIPPRAVEGFLPQVDAVVELEGEDEPRQRWHLPDESLSTAWLEL